MKKYALAFIAFFVSLATAQADLAMDDATNYAGDINGQNGGTGFLAWSVTSGGAFAGNFLGDSTAGAGDINTGGNSIGLFANPGGAFINADRGFISELVAGETFSIQLGLNFANGNKGINLFADTQGEVFNFNVGNNTGTVSSANAVLNPATSGYDYGGNNAVIDLSFTITSATSFDYSVSRTSEQGIQGTLFDGSVSGLTDGVSGFRLYNSGTDNGDAQNNLYANNLSVVPEPSSLLLVGLGLLGGAHLRKRR